MVCLSEGYIGGLFGHLCTYVACMKEWLVVVDQFISELCDGIHYRICYSLFG